MNKFIIAGINRYKARKYRRHFSAWLTNAELDLTVEWLYFLTRPGIEVVYDVGAADGHFAGACSKLSNITSVAAFEPGAEALVGLNRLARKVAKITVVPVALGSSSGLHSFYVTKDGKASSCLPPDPALERLYPGRGFQEELTVPVETLDSAVKDRQLSLPDVIKLDTQGYEIEVLKGATKTIDAASFCIVECSYELLYEDAPLVGDVYKYFDIRGWRNVGTAPSSRTSTGKPVYTDLVFASPKGRQRLRHAG